MDDGFPDQPNLKDERTNSLLNDRKFLLYKDDETKRENGLQKFWELILQINQDKLTDRKEDFFVEKNDTFIEETWKSDHLRLQERKNEYTEKLLAIATKEQPERYNLGELVLSSDFLLSQERIQRTRRSIFTIRLDEEQTKTIGPIPTGTGKLRVNPTVPKMPSKIIIVEKETSKLVDFTNSKTGAAVTILVLIADFVFVLDIWRIKRKSSEK